VSAPQAPVFAANWKMFKGPAAAREFVSAFAALYAPREDASVVIFPPSISLDAFASASRGRPDLRFGVQDVHDELEGPHTGATSASMVPETGATWGLAGHSERRREFGDDDDTVARKLGRLLQVGLRAVLCVGETLEEREGGYLGSVLDRQIAAALSPLSEDQRRSLVYAYEPVWAIGTGRTATPEDAAQAHALVRENVGRSIDSAAAEQAIVLYGGSVKPANIAELLGSPGVDGVLVGGASLDVESWAAICNSGRAGLPG